MALNFNFLTIDKFYFESSCNLHICLFKITCILFCVNLDPILMKVTQNQNNEGK